MKITKKDINWCDKPILGMALIILDKNAIDSTGKPVDPRRFYEVGKHKQSGKVAIVPTENYAKESFKFGPRHEAMIKQRDGSGLDKTV